MHHKKRTRKRTRKKHTIRQKQKKQIRGILNRYDFSYNGRDIVNQAAKVAPGVIKASTNDINNIAKQRINQVISQGTKEMEQYFPKF